MTGRMANVHFFGGGKADGGRELRDLLGGKGANLAEMARLGLPVPPGFTLTTEVCRQFFAGGGVLPEGLDAEIDAALRKVETVSGRRFGGATEPLLLSVRSGARASMPGMMDTVLDLGLDEAALDGLAGMSGSLRFALDCERRFLAGWGGVVRGLGDGPFQALLEELKRERGAASDSELDESDLWLLVHRSRALIAERTGAPPPADPREQLRGAIEAVFRSWENPRAAAYRKLNGIPSHWGTAVTVQMMVFGNLDESSGTGVVFTRDPSSGEPCLTGEFLPAAQGEDVVAGARTPLPLEAMRVRTPEAHRLLAETCATLERHFADAQDVEFTVERGKLYVLQCRSAKRTGPAAVRIAVDLAEEGLISRDEALLRVPAEDLAQLLRPVFDEPALRSAHAEGRVLGVGLAAGPGAASGRIALTAGDAERIVARGERAVLVRPQTSPEDIRGLSAAAALVTSFGGMTSHAALLARQMGKVAVVGICGLHVDEAAGIASFSGGQGGVRHLRAGDEISVDGTSGEVLEGSVSTRPSEVLRALAEGGARTPLSERYQRLMSWADHTRRLGVRANADLADQAQLAVALGAEGVGLCRTEHMFFGEPRIGLMRRMVLARSDGERNEALARLLPLQRSDFAALFRAMGGRPVTIRTLDPPLHEFLPHDEAGLLALADAMGRPPEEVRLRAQELTESNPMLGLRGCRLGIAHSQITAMQARAIFEAAAEVTSEGLAVDPEIMVPLVGDARELQHQIQVIDAAARAVIAERQVRIPYRVGTMIEVPRAALTARQIAGSAEFFSFGTNDLTQTTYALSRDDVRPVLARYLELGIYQSDPFVTLDAAGVGELMRIALREGRAARPDLKTGICGEHGGDPRSIRLCHQLQLDYVSCSPMRLPIARLAAAQAALA